MSDTTTQWQPLQIRYGVLLAVLAGFLQAFSFPNLIFTGHSVWHTWIALIAFVPFIYLWRRTTWVGTGVYSFLMGFFYFIGILAWIRLIGRNTNIDNAFAWIFFAVCGGIYFALFGLTARLTKNRLKLPDSLVLPLAWVAWEYLRGHILTGGWPWGSLGHTQYGNVVLRQMASVVGVGGISFLVLLVNIWITNGLEKILHKPKDQTWSLGYFLPRRPSFPQWFQEKPFATGLSIGMLLLWLILGGICVTETIQFAKTKTTEVKLALVQGNINTRQKWNRKYRDAAMKKMSALHAQAAQGRPDLIVWAESCFPGILEHPGYQQWEDQLRALIIQGKTPTLLTSNEYQREKNLEAKHTWHHYNSAFYFDSLGETIGRYRKIHLVPFGEYIPYTILKKHLQTVVQEPIPIDFEPGDDYSVFKLGKSTFAALICYEDLFEELGFHLARAGADFFLCMANNSWSGKSAMSYQHSAMSVFLAVEHRAYVAKADMTGPTCVIDPWGNIGEHLEYYIAGVKHVTIYPAVFRTFFTRFGNIIPFFFLLLFSGLLAAAFYQPKKS
ncbi:apolipoprotein N-acyltransferase [bacterium]|nr:apolipoprotein N-acyltransferase [bacterium]